MTEEKLLETVEKNFRIAVSMDEFDQFLRGINKYYIYSKDSYLSNKTEPWITLYGLENMAKKYRNSNIDKYVENQMIKMLESDNIENTFCVLSILKIYIKDQKNIEKYFKLDFKKILELLKKKISEQKEEMQKFKKEEFNTVDTGMYGVVENIAVDFEAAGYKII